MRTKTLYRELRRYGLGRSEGQLFVKMARQYCRTNEEIREMAFQAFVRLPVIYGLETVYARMKARESE